MVHKEGIYVGYHFWPLFTVGFHFRICRSGHQNQTKQLSTGSQKKYSTRRREQADKPEKSKRSWLRSKLSLVKVLAQNCLCGKRLVEGNMGNEKTRTKEHWKWETRLQGVGMWLYTQKPQQSSLLSLLRAKLKSGRSGLKNRKLFSQSELAECGNSGRRPELTHSISQTQWRTFLIAFNWMTLGPI